MCIRDSTKRDGRAIEEIGKYHPTEEPSLIDIDLDRANYWLSNGAQPTEAVAALLKKYEEGTVRVKEPKPSKKDLYEAAVAAAGKSADDASGATTPRKKAAPKKEEAVAEAPAEASAEAPADAEVAPAADTDSSGAASESVSSDADDAAKDEA